MKKLMSILSVLLLFIISDIAAVNYIDSLKNLISKAANDSLRFDYLNKIAIAYSDSSYDKSIDYWKKGLKVATKSKNRPQMAHASHQIGSMLIRKGEFPEALFEYNNALSIHQYQKDIRGEGQLFNDIGIVYKTWGNYEKALENFINALRCFDQIEDSQGLAMASNNIGQIYYYRDDYARAISYFQIYLKNSELNNSKHAIAGASNNIAAAYVALGNFDKAHEYYNKSKIIYDSLGVKLGVAILSDNIGSLLAKNENFNEAIEQHYKALNIFEELKSWPRKAFVFKNLGYAYFKLDDYIKSKDYFLQSKALSKSYNQLENLKEVYYGLSEINENTRNYAEALRYHKLYVQLKDSLMNAETIEKLNTLEVRYETEKKTRELQILNTKIERNKQNGLIAILVAILFMFSITLLVRENLNKRKILKKSQLFKNSIENALFVFKSFVDKHSDDINKVNQYFLPKTDLESSKLLAIKYSNSYYTVFVLIDKHLINIDTNLANVLITASLVEFFKKEGLPTGGKIDNNIKELLQIETNNKGKIYSNMMSIILIDNLNSMYDYIGENKLVVIHNNEEKIDFQNENKGFFLKNTSLYFFQFSEDASRKASKENFENLILKTLNSSRSNTFEERRSLLESTIEFWTNSFSNENDILFIGMGI